jgi:hypothetical protein
MVELEILENLAGVLSYIQMGGGWPRIAAGLDQNLLPSKESTRDEQKGQENR